MGRDDFGGARLDDREESLGLLDGFGAVGRLQADALSMPVDLIAVVIDSSGPFGVNRSDVETQTFLSHGWEAFHFVRSITKINFQEPSVNFRRVPNGFTWLPLLHSQGAFSISTVRQSANKKINFFSVWHLDMALY
ncbi:hypothetical protein SDC9_187740 [bioreactor metagenome]|uniref:Uncharacterized protein n=1 Tax=bioreactor metagenome TaxID=1076179 RepID=A0A645HVK9_9ZZZZ